MGLVGTARPATRSGDLVADVVATSRRNTAVYSRNLFHAPWGFGIPPMHVASFQVVTSGACWLVPESGDPVHLTHGDAVLVPSGSAYSMVDTPGTPVRQLTELVGGPLGETPSRTLVLDGSGPATGLLCGGYLLDPGPRHPLTAVLPPVVHITAEQARGTGLAAAVDLLSDEVDRADPVPRLSSPHWLSCFSSMSCGPGSPSTARTPTVGCGRCTTRWSAARSRSPTANRTGHGV